MKILEKLSRERIFDIEVNADKNLVTFTEACDRNFEYSLTKQDLDKLIQELTDVSQSMEPSYK